MNKDVLGGGKRTLLILLVDITLSCTHLTTKYRRHSFDGSRRVGRRRESGFVVALGGSIPQLRGWHMHRVTGGLEALFFV